MEFSSLFFIQVFLPLTILVYYLFLFFFKEENRRTCLLNGILLLFSLFFYLWAGLKAFFLFLAMILLNYGAGLWIGHYPLEDPAARKKRKTVFITAVIFNILILAFFKYFNMIFALAEIFLKPRARLIEYGYALAVFSGTGSGLLPHIAMPLAISFISFQLISYIADVYKGQNPAERNILRFSLYNCLFAQLLQGPIIRFNILDSQIKHRCHSLLRFSEGIRRFCFGLGKKVLLANTLAVTADKIWNKPVTDLYTSEAWLGLIFYILQIYYDFSGYSDMAVGIGSMFGFEIPENFNYPLTSQSIQDFWHRWHISLSTWFRDYVYFPLGGSRKGTARTYVNILIIFLLTGIWHGANLTFLCWGFIVAVQSIMERTFLLSLLKKNPVKLINWFYFIFTFSLQVVLFRAPNLYHGVKFYGVLFGGIPESPGTSLLSYFNADLFIMLTAALLGIGFIQRLFRAPWLRIRNNSAVLVIRTAFAFAVLIWSVLLLMNGSYNPSIYTAF